MSGADGASPGVVNVDVDGANPRPDDDAGGSLWGLVMRGVDIGIPRSSTLGDATLAHGSLGIVGLGVSGLLLLGSHDFPHPPINWRRVEDNTEFTCSQVATAERLLHEILASVGRNILRPILFSLKKERKVCISTSGFL
jgi:hypothetical protein